MLLAYAKKLLGVWNEPRRYEQLYSIIGDIEAAKIMEIGTWRGRRAKQMILEALRHNPPDQVAYVGFDLFETPSSETMAAEFSDHKRAPAMDIVREELAVTGVDVRLYKGDTTKILPGLVAELPKMDFIFIDGGHSLETIQSDWDCVRRLMHDKTVVVFDDYWPNRMDGGAKPIVDAIDHSQYDVNILPRTDIFINPDYGRLVIRFATVRKIILQ